MKNTIISTAVVIGLILFLRITALSGNQTPSDIRFSYLNGEILFDYNPDSHIVEFYFERFDRFTQGQESNKLRRLEEINPEVNSCFDKDNNLLTKLTINDFSLNQEKNVSCFENQDAISCSNFDAFRGNSISIGDKKKMTDKPKTLIISSPCGICNNFLITCTSANETVERFGSIGNNPVIQGFDEDYLGQCSPTPEPQTIFLFGSSLISLGIIKRFRSKKTFKI
jgi:hypothetical protein